MTAKVADKAGNVHNSNIITFYNDVTGPGASVSNIVTDDYYNASNLSDIDGTASDVTGGVSKVYVCVKEETNFWDPDSKAWVSGIANIKWITAYSTTTPSYEVWHVTGINWVDGIKHYIWMKIYDAAGNLTKYGNFNGEGAGQDIDNNLNYHRRFDYDETAPSSDVPDDGIVPDNNAYYNVKYGTFTGTCDDPIPGSGISYVKAKIQRSNGDWWRDTYWGASMDLSAIYTAPSDWEYDIPADKRDIFYGNGEEKYVLYSVAYDYAGNVEALSAKCTFYYDVVKPTTSISYPGDGQYYTSGEPTVVKGGYYDGYSGIDFVKVRISSGSYYWYGSSWTTPGNWLDANVFASSWTYTSLTGAWKNAGQYAIETYAADKSGNVQSSTPTVSFTYDDTEPESFVNTPADGGVYESMGTVSGTAADALSGVNSVKVVIQENFSPYSYYDIANSSWVPNAYGVVYNTTTYAAGAGAATRET